MNLGNLPAVSIDPTLPVPNYKHVNEIDFAEHFGLTTLRTIDKSHMDEDARAELSAVFGKLREWKERLKTVPDASFVLLGNPGIGKTHIARAAHDSMCSVQHGFDDMIDLNDPDSLSLIRHSRFYTAKEVMSVLVDGTFKIETRTVYKDFQPMQVQQIKMIVIDEVGREGKIQWEKADYESQESAKRDHYFTLINKMVGKCGFFMTSNVTALQFREFFDGATYSRIMGMCAPGHIYEMTKVPDYRTIISGRA